MSSDIITLLLYGFFIGMGAMVIWALLNYAGRRR